MKIAFIFLCHGDVEHIEKSVNLPFFNSDDVKIYLHYDASMPKKSANELKKIISCKERLHFIEKREKCKWGEFSLVQATLNTIDVICKDEHFEPDYIFLMSASCIPIQPLAHLQSFLSSNNGLEFIQASDVRHVRWIAGGWDKERYKYYFPFNYYDNRWWFQLSCDIQEKLNVTRKNILGANIYFGSQWFCLTRQCCYDIAGYLKSKNIKRFFKNSWIPDEFCFQTLAVKLRGIENVANRNLTYFQFNSFGRPLVLHEDHLDYIRKQPFFFVRKVSPEATTLLQQLSIDSSIKSKRPEWININNVGQVTLDYAVHKKLSELPEIRTKIGLIVEQAAVKAEISKPIYNLSKKSKSHHLKQINKPYFCLIGSSYQYLYQINQYIKSLNSPSFKVLGNIFNHANMDFMDSNDIYINNAKEQEKRNNDPITYLENLLVKLNDYNIVLTHLPNFDIHAINDLFLQDPNCKFIDCNIRTQDLTLKVIASLSEAETGIWLNLTNRLLKAIFNETVASLNKNSFEVWHYKNLSFLNESRIIHLETFLINVFNVSNIPNVILTPNQILLKEKLDHLIITEIKN